MNAEPAPLGLIAGGGGVPYEVARRVTKSGRGVCVVGLAGMAEPRLMMEFSGTVARLGEAGKIVGTLREAGCRELVMIGYVARPDFSALKPDAMALRVLPRILAAAMRGDAALLKAVAKLLEEEGLTIRSAQEVAPVLKIAPGPLRGGPAPEERHWPDIVRGAEVVERVGELDIGQAAIVCEGLVLCVEAQEGTAAMLQRCAALPEPVRGTRQARRGVMLKAPKTIQDRRTDLPVIGLQTIVDADAAGLAGIALEAEGALVLNEEEVVDAAAAAGLFVYGYTGEEIESRRSASKR